MIALLKLVPVRYWEYLVLAVALCGAFGWYTMHERSIEHAKDEAAAAALVAKDNAQVAKVDSAAKSTESQNAIIYEKAVAIPPVGDIGVLCQRTGGVPLPAPDSKSSAAAGVPSSDRGVGPTYDPSGALLTRAAKADAQIIYLQGRIRELEAQMQGAP